MASFSAALQVAGLTYPVRSCTYEFSQATDGRGRVVAKVRHGLVRLTLDVPDDDLLLDWANTPHKLLAGQVLFCSAQGGPVLETLAWEAGQCVGYQEEFASGDQSQGAYVCHLTIAAPALTVQPGGPAAYLTPAPGEHGTPPQALQHPLPLVVAPATPPLVEKLVVPTVEEVAAAVGEKALEGLAATAAAAALPVALTLALLLGSATPAQAPGIPQPHLLPVDPDELRLRELVAQHAAGTLTAEEETELVSLLAKVKGIYIKKLADLERTVPGRTLPSHLPSSSAVPRGTKAKIRPKDDLAKQRALTRENEAAGIIAKEGYDIEQNPTIAGVLKKPDYKIEGKIFDCYAPTRNNPRAIWSSIRDKIEEEQTQRVVLNLDDSDADTKALFKQFSEYPISNLEEVIIVKRGSVFHLLP